MHHGLGAIAHAQFLQDRVDMYPHRTGSNMQGLGDVLVALALGDQVQDFLFPVGEVFDRP